MTNPAQPSQNTPPTPPPEQQEEQVYSLSLDSFVSIPAPLAPAGPAQNTTTATGLRPPRRDEFYTGRYRREYVQTPRHPSDASEVGARRRTTPRTIPDPLDVRFVEFDDRTVEGEQLVPPSAPQVAVVVSDEHVARGGASLQVEQPLSGSSGVEGDVVGGVGSG